MYTDRDLIIAEVETSTAIEAEELRPIGLDVTAIEKYKNKSLAKYVLSFDSVTSEWRHTFSGATLSYAQKNGELRETSPLDC